MERNLHDEFACSIVGCNILAVYSDGKDQWCDKHKPSRRDMKKYDVRPIRRVDIPDYPY